MSAAYIVMLALAFCLLVAAEWPRIAHSRPGRALHLDRERPARPERIGQTRKERLAEKAAEAQEADDFAAAVKRDLDSLPTVDEDELRRML